MSEMTEQQIHALNIITNNEPISGSDLTRRMWGKGYKGTDRDYAIRELLDMGMIKKFQQRVRIRRTGFAPTMYEATAEGHHWIDDYVEQQDCIGAC